MAKSYTVQLDVFEGPLQLLLEIIEHAELDITRVALARVTDQYLAHLQRYQDQGLADLSSFLVIAARLLQIKSEALLPKPPEREPGQEDVAGELARKLKTYKKFKQAAGFLNKRRREGLQSYIRLAPQPARRPTLDLAGFDSLDLRLAFIEALQAAPGPVKMDRVVIAPKVRIRDKIRLILDSLRRRRAASFRTLFQGATSRIEVVVSFLAVLELIKRKQIVARQDELFGDISLEPGDEWRDDQDTDFELEFEG